MKSTGSAFPSCCAPEAYQLLGRQLDAIESPDGLLNGAIAMAIHHIDNIDPVQVDQTLQKYADTVRARVRGTQPQAIIAHLHALLFEELGFTGNIDNYYTATNSYLPVVLETKRGLPITLSLIYKAVAERLGLHVWGVGLPGHFMCGIECDGNQMMVDPFAQGRIVSVEEARGRIAEMFGTDVEWSDEFLAPVSNRQWLTRMLQNLLRVFAAKNQYADVAAILEMEMLLWPEQDHLQRDLGLVLARLGLTRPASIWLDTYLKNNPNDPQRGDLEQLRNVLLT